MKRLLPLFAGLFGTFAFSWLGLTAIPNWQIGHLDPQADEEGTDIYPQPQSGMVDRGRRVYNANGCVYCHTLWVRADYAGSDIDRNWGVRRSAPRDYIFDRPVLLGKMRAGQDLSNQGHAKSLGEQSPAPAGSPAPSPASSPGPVAAAGASPSAAPSPATAASPTATQPPVPGASPATPTAAADASLGQKEGSGEPPVNSPAWHHLHLYSPQSFAIDSNMPAYRFLYQKRLISGERSPDALPLKGEDAPPQGWEIVPTYDAQCLVAYLMSLDQSHPLNETKSALAKATTAMPVAGSPSPAASVAPPK